MRNLNCKNIQFIKLYAGRDDLGGKLYEVYELLLAELNIVKKNDLCMYVNAQNNYNYN